MTHDIITSKRLLVRPITTNDADAIHEYTGDKSITMMTYIPKETKADTEDFVSYAVAEWNKSFPGDREYVIVYEGIIVGGINLERRHSANAYEIGWIVRKDYRCKGIATEAATALIEYAFNTLSASKVMSHCDSANSASERVMQKLGMTLTDNTKTRFYPKTGITSGELQYEITREEYNR